MNTTFYRLLLQNLQMGVVVHAPDTRVIFSNEQAAHLLGLSIEQIQGKTVLDPDWCFIHENQTPFQPEEYPANVVIATHQPLRRLILGIRRPERSRPVWVLVHAFPEFVVRSRSKPRLKQVVVTFADITERKVAEERIEHLTRLYQMLSETNQAIVRLDNAAALYLRICHVAVEFGGYLGAWIGLVDEQTQRIAPVAMAGAIDDYIRQIRISTDPAQREGQGPTAVALRQGQSYYCDDFLNDPATAPWHDRGRRFGIRASVALPLRRGGSQAGVFTLYASEPYYFDPSMRALLEEIAWDMSFALDNFDRETARVQAELALRQAATVFESAHECIIITDAQECILRVNRAFSAQTGYAEAEARGRTPRLLQSSRQVPEFYRAMWASISATGYWRGEIWNRRKNGEVYPALLSISAVQDATGAVTHYVGILADRSALRASEAQVEFLVHHDPLTRLPNRRLLIARLEHVLGQARCAGGHLALLMLDLDRFKDINDSYGHLAGDELLQQVAERLTRRMRSADTITRLGGDEFALLLENLAHPQDAAQRAIQIINTLKEPWRLPNGAEVHLSVSIGISLFPEHGQTAEDLLQQADTALYRAKAEGRGRFQYFSAHLTQEVRQRLELENRLRRALVERQFRVYYQPQVEIGSGRIIGAEALVRWQDPEHGLIPPIRFIPVAEETGLINAIGEWVLWETCRQGKAWLDAGLPPLILAVNLSPHQLHHRDLVATVARTLKATGFPAEWLELELTESALMQRETEAVAILERLRGLGLHLAMDDFGTGYSSLAYLKRFPLDVLKVDKSFIDDLPQQREAMEITAAIIAMGHALGLKVLAEGVETAAQRDFLQCKGCDRYQGYLTSPPIPAEAFIALLTPTAAER